MDIFHLLEALNPAGNVVTVKIDDGKSLWDEVSGFLIAIAPAVIALGAILFSHRQFERNISQQALHFQAGVKQQLRELRLQAQLATEIELKKEACRDIREACVNFLEYAGSFFSNNCLYREYLKIPVEKRPTQCQELIDAAFNASMNDAKGLSSSRVMLKTFLDPVKDEQFLTVIDYVVSMAYRYGVEGAADELGDANQCCLTECQKYIASIHKEIVMLTETIKSDD